MEFLNIKPKFIEIKIEKIYKKVKTTLNNFFCLEVPNK